MSQRTVLSILVALGCATAIVGLRATPLPAARAAVAAATLPAQGEPHPELNQAIRALEAAKAHLRGAAHDFGGHRAAALAAVDLALAQLRAALVYDTK